MGRGDFHDNHLKTVARNCPNLEVFLSEDSQDVTDSGIETLAMNCPKLSTFVLNNMSSKIYGVTDQGIISLVTKCSKLVDIYIANAMMTDEATKKIGEHRTNLEILGLGYMNITDLGMENVVTKCIKLRDLCLRKAHITDKTLKLLGENCPDIEELELDGCDRITETGVRNFVKQGSKPLKLSIVDVNQECVQYMKKLKEEFQRLLPIPKILH